MMGDQLDVADTDPFGYDDDLPDAPEHHLRRRHSISSKTDHNNNPDTNLDIDPVTTTATIPANDTFPQNNTIPTIPTNGTNGTSNNASSASTNAAAVQQETDTCRICRAEGTTDEPLFYPCKCSGSIKYVHQNCLMEWLSHSQKKHCELCKTSFRFTKLYSPNMPSRLPIHVFISHLARYMLRNLLVWMRALLVVGVWLGWLPFCMRMIWSTMFWVSDFGFGGTTIFGFMPNPPHNHFVSTNVTSAAAWAASASSLVGAHGTCPTPVSPLVGLTYNRNGNLPDLHGVNLNETDLPFLSYMRFFLAGFGLVELDGSPKPSHRSTVPEHISLLSDVGFLRNLTRNSFINNAVISVLEGQIITVLVVICFILIILVRDYVVQQQPEINMRAAFAAAEHQLLPPPIQEQVHPDHDNDPVEPQVLAPILGEGGGGELGEGIEDEDEDEDEEYDEGDDEEDYDEEGDRDEDELDSEQEDDKYDEDECDESHISARDSLDLGEAEENDHIPSVAAERGAPEQEVKDEEALTVEEFLAIYKEAGGDYKRILEIIHDKNLEEKMQFWVHFSTQIMNQRHLSAEWRGGDGDEAGPSTANQRDIHNANHLATIGGSSSSAESAESGFGGGQGGQEPKDWAWPDNSAEVERSGRPADKGKGKAIDESSEWWEDQDTSSGSGDSLAAKINRAATPEFNFNTALPRTFETTGGAVGGTEEYIRALHEERTAANLARVEINTDIAAAAAAANNQAVLEAYQAQERPREIQAQVPEHNEEVANRRRRGGMLHKVADFMWGPVEAQVVQDTLPDADPAGLANPPVDNHGLEPDELELLDMEDMADLEQEAIDDAEDFDGIMELFGMRGPLFTLFQNALFCALLVAITVFFAIFLPYNVGRIALWVTANPGRAVQSLVLASQLIEDVLMTILGSVIVIASYCAKMVVAPFNVTNVTTETLRAVVGWSFNVTVDSGWRIASNIHAEYAIMTSTDVGNFSAASHIALYEVKDHIGTVLSGIIAPFVVVFAQNESTKAEASQLLVDGTSLLWDTARNLPATALNPSSWVVNMPQGPINALEPVYWTSWDRFLAILFGYLAMTVMAGFYLSKGRQFTGALNNGQDWDTPFVDGLNQASGVMKVILIISIEMLAFPLYCGLLLDVALMPLFEDTTIESRVLFTMNNPVTSVFVHWFVGTGYMFHFALFVSMCRKIMRKGVLYFIRDPDDPEFHPVRDVLERNVTTQLRKILFSAFVYGALVMVCLGGVVWGLWFALPSVLPIHYSSNEPVLEFPIDLLFYNFLMPLAVKFFKPSVGLHKMYTWWFRKCGRMLRITWFLFGERQIDEEGKLALRSHSPFETLPFWKKMFLEVDSKRNKVRPKTWAKVFEIGKRKPYAEMKDNSRTRMDKTKAQLISTGELVVDGRFVRTPCSDQAKIPKGSKVFLEVDETNSRIDGLPDRPESDLYSNKGQYQFAYIPPHFKVRVFLFILFIWLFAAITGVGFTIIPLVFGRMMFQFWLPVHVRTNDIYAFSIGVYVLGTTVYGLFHLHTLLAKAVAWGKNTIAGLDKDSVAEAVGVAAHVGTLVYSYLIILIVFPLLVSVFMELYVIIPLHTEMYGASLDSLSASSPAASMIGAAAGDEKRHTIRIVQSWTLGLVYLKLLARFLTTQYDGTRLASSIRAVLRRGWLYPDAGVLTRAFVLPAVFVVAVGIIAPALGAGVFINWARSRAVSGGVFKDAVATNTEGRVVGVADTGELADAVAAFAVGVGGVGDGRDGRTGRFNSPHDAAIIHRLAYPATAVLAAGLIAGYRTAGLMGTWRTRVKDEAYLVGERLHNFSISRSGWRGTGGHAGVSTRVAGHAHAHANGERGA